MNVYEIKTMAERLAGNTYPGRGIVLGMTPDGTQAVAAYFIMGRSVNSRNRDMDSQSEDDEHHEGEEDAIFEFFVGKKVCDHRPHIRSPLLFHLLLRFSAERLL